MSMNASGSKSSSSSSSSSDVWGKQSPYLTDLYSQAQSQMPAQEPYTGAAQKSYWDQAYNQEQDYLAAKQGFEGTLGQGNTYEQLGQQASGTLQDVMTQDPVNNPYLQQNVQNALGAQSQEFMRNVMPGIRSGAQGAGQYGSSRHGIAEGIALSDLASQQGSTAQQMYGQAYDQGMQNKLQATGQSAGMLGQGTQTGLAQLEGYGQLANLGMIPGQAYEQAGQVGFNPLDRYANIIGAPTVLSESQSKSKSSSFGGGGGM